MRRLLFVLTAIGVLTGGLAAPASAARPLRPPTNLVASSVTATSARIEWAAASEATGYEVQRATTSGGPYTSVARVTTLFYSDAALTPGTAYFYVVRSTNGSRVSAPSDQLRVATTMPPPANLRHTAYRDRVELAWDPVPGAEQYRVTRIDEYGTNPVSFGPIATPSFVDTTVAAASAYAYRVESSGSGGNSISDYLFVFTGAPTAITVTVSPSPNEEGGFVLLTATIRSLDPAVPDADIGGEVVFYHGAERIRVADVSPGRAVAEVRWRAGAGVVSAFYRGWRVTTPIGSSGGATVRHSFLDGAASPRIAVDAWRIYGYGQGTSWPASAAVADVTGDGRPDALMTTSVFSLEDETDFRLWVFAQQPDGTLAEPPLVLPTHGGASMAMATGDVDADGDADVAVSVRDGVDVFRQDGGRLTEPVLVPVAGGNNRITGDVRLADLNADGRDDIVAAGVSGVVVVPAAPDGGFAAPVLVTAEPRVQVDVADVTGDGRPDVLTRNEDQLRTVFAHEQTDTGFVERWRHVVPTGYSPLINSFAAGDITGDGRADLVVSVDGNDPGSRLQLYVQQPTGLFGEPITYPAYDIPGPLALTDFDGDGRRDVVVVHDGWATATVMTQRADGRLGIDQHFSLPLFTGHDQRGLAVGDVTGDGKADVVATNHNYGLVVKPQA